MTNMSSQPLWLTHFFEILLVPEFQLIKFIVGTFSYKAHFRPQISSNGKLRPLDGGVHINNLSPNGHNVKDWWISDLEKRSAIEVTSIQDWQILLNILSIIARHATRIPTTRMGSSLHTYTRHDTKELVYICWIAMRKSWVGRASY